MKKRLYRSQKDKMIAGVCGGIAEYFKIDPTIVRILIVLLAISTPQIFIITYIISAVVIPERPIDYIDDEEEVEVLDKDGNKVDKQHDSRRVLGMIFVGAGALMLVSKSVSWFDSSMLLAIGIIAVGIYVLMRKDHREE